MTPKNQIIIDNRWVEGEIKKYRSKQEQLQQNQREKEVQRQRDEQALNDARNDSQRSVGQS